MTTYTIVDFNSGKVQQRDASLQDAAIELLTYDGHEYDIRPASDGKGFELYISNFSRNSSAFNGLTRSVIFSIKSDYAEAETDIFQRVIDSGKWTRPDVMTDESYDDMQAQLQADAK